MTREDLTEYSGYGENADRMRAIPEKYFLFILFKIAALIDPSFYDAYGGRSEDSDRNTQALRIFQALLYRNIWDMHSGRQWEAVCSVYWLKKILPYIIVTAYGIMYPHIDTVVIITLYYGVSASLTALAHTMGATWFSCYKGIERTGCRIVDAPSAPKKGKQYFGEDSIFVESVQFYLEGDDSESAAL